jgi:hypothetical protein
VVELERELVAEQIEPEAVVAAVTARAGHVVADGIVPADVEIEAGGGVVERGGPVSGRAAMPIFRLMPACVGP